MEQVLNATRATLDVLLQDGVMDIVKIDSSHREAIKEDGSTKDANPFLFKDIEELIAKEEQELDDAITRLRRLYFSVRIMQCKEAKKNFETEGRVTSNLATNFHKRQ